MAGSRKVTTMAAKGERCAHINGKILNRDHKDYNVLHLEATECHFEALISQAQPHALCMELLFCTNWTDLYVFCFLQFLDILSSHWQLAKLTLLLLLVLLLVPKV